MRHMTDEVRPDEPGSSPTRSGAVYAVLRSMGNKSPVAAAAATITATHTATGTATLTPTATNTGTPEPTWTSEPPIIYKVSAGDQCMH